MKHNLCIRGLGIAPSPLVSFNSPTTSGSLLTNASFHDTTMTPDAIGSEISTDRTKKVPAGIRVIVEGKNIPAVKEDRDDGTLGSDIGDMGSL